MRKPTPTLPPAPWPRTRTPAAGCTVEAPGLYVWEETPADANWAHDLAAFARAFAEARGR